MRRSFLWLGWVVSLLLLSVRSDAQDSTEFLEPHKTPEQHKDDNNKSNPNNSSSPTDDNRTTTPANFSETTVNADTKANIPPSSTNSRSLKFNHLWNSLDSGERSQFDQKQERFSTKTSAKNNNDNEDDPSTFLDAFGEVAKDLVTHHIVSVDVYGFSCMHYMSMYYSMSLD